MVQMRELQVTDIQLIRITIKINYFVKLSHFCIVKCNPPNYCCDKSYSGCRGRCIPENMIKDGKQDCENGSDERGAFNFITHSIIEIIID